MQSPLKYNCLLEKAVKVVRQVELRLSFFLMCHTNVIRSFASQNINRFSILFEQTHWGSALQEAAREVISSTQARVECHNLCPIPFRIALRASTAKQGIGSKGVAGERGKGWLQTSFKANNFTVAVTVTVTGTVTVAAERQRGKFNIYGSWR